MYPRVKWLLLPSDFDLRKSVHNPAGLDDDYILRPTLRLVDDNTAGALTGTVASGVITADADPTDGPVDFIGETSVTITAGKTTGHNFQ